MTSSAAPLAGKSVLVLEDEYFIATQITTLLTEARAWVIGSFPICDAARDAATPDAAVLDINLGGEMQFQLADSLAAQNVPFVFSSGYDRMILPRRHQNRPFCLKPMLKARLIGLLSDALR